MKFHLSSKILRLRDVRHEPDDHENTQGRGELAVSFEPI